MNQTTYYHGWYERNKARVSESRKARYREDPAYRKIVQQRAGEYRERTRVPRPPIEGLTLSDVCEALDVSPWTIHNWKTLGYYPEPKRVSGRPVFTVEQMSLLGLIKEFFKTYPRKRAGLHRDKLQAIADLVHHNWSD